MKSIQFKLTVLVFVSFMSSSFSKDDNRNYFHETIETNMKYLMKELKALDTIIEFKKLETPVYKIDSILVRHDSIVNRNEN